MKTNDHMEARSGQNHDNKIAPQANFHPTAANIMDLCFFVITKQYFFQRVSELFLTSMNYFWYNYTNNFFIHTTNFSGTSKNFSNVHGELFLAVSQIKFLAYNALRALQLKGTYSSV